MNLPAEFVEKIKQLFVSPDEAQRFFDSLEKPRHYGIRVNTLKVSVDDFHDIFADIVPSDWCSTGFYYTGQNPPSKNPLYHCGLYYIQEPSAMSAAAILDVKPGDKVLDLCASPGGKSTQMAAALAGQGLLVANDANQSRIPQLVRNLEVAGVTNAVILRETPERLARHFPDYFDKILVDAPCSGEGMFRKNLDAVLAWDKNKAARLAAIQADILENAAQMLKPGGILAYSTCTFNPTENENVIWNFLERHQDFAIVPIRHTDFGVSPANEGLCLEHPIPHAARIWPHRQRGEGHFIALLQKNGEISDSHQMKRQSLSKYDNKFYNEFCAKYLRNQVQSEVYAHRDGLFVLPPECPSVAGLHVVRLGLFLGSLQKQRFTPSYALAMTLVAADFADNAVISLHPDDPRLELYLRGETFQIDAPDGYNLVCIGAYSLGFAKVLAGRLKGRINGR